MKLTLPVFSVSTDDANWVAIVRAETAIEAAVIVISAMEPVMPPDKQVHVITQSNNADALARLGARDLIAWRLNDRESA